MASTRPKIYEFTFMNDTTLHVDNVMAHGPDLNDGIVSLRQAVIEGELTGREINVNLANVKYYTVRGPRG